MPTDSPDQTPALASPGSVPLGAESLRDCVPNVCLVHKPVRTALWSRSAAWGIGQSFVLNNIVRGVDSGHQKRG